MSLKLIDKIKNKVNKPGSYIKTGKVYVNHQKIEDVNYQVKDNDLILIKNIKKYVSRGSYKLLAAIKYFKINFNDKIVLDIGASKGGFTQVAIEAGAKKVYALDVGKNQLDFKLRTNNRVVVLEKTNLKNIDKSVFKENIDIVLADVSFISLRRVFDVLENFNNIILMALIKPQFEAFKDEVSKGGFVNESKHKKIINKITTYAMLKKFKCKKIKLSPIVGVKSKNKEYISLFIKE